MTFQVALAGSCHANANLRDCCTRVGKYDECGYQTWWRVGVAAVSQSAQVTQAHAAMAEKNCLGKIILSRFNNEY